MRWKDGIIIAVIFFVIGITVEYLLLGCITFGKFWGLLNGVTGFVLGLLIGLFGGSDILAFIYNWYQKRKEKLEQERDKERIYNWLYNETKQFSRFGLGEPNDPRWRSTEEIASLNNLTDERVKNICRSNEKITQMTKKDLWPRELLEEKWAIKEFVR